MSDDNGNGKDKHRPQVPFGKPDWGALERETRWELAGLVVLLVVAVSMAVAVNFYRP